MNQSMSFTSEHNTSGLTAGIILGNYDFKFS